MGNMLSQCFNIPEPTLTEKNLPDQTGKVHIVTGGYAGVGLELAKILYQKNAVVYLAGRSQDKASKSIAEIQQQFPNATGRLEFLKVDFSNLSTIKPAADEFMAKESRLDVLTNNAGVMQPPAGSKDAHGNDLTFGTNLLGPFLFTKLLTPTLLKTAQNAPAGSVRVTWASSLGAELGGPKGGVQFNEDGTIEQFRTSSSKAYAQSKSANNLLAAEFAAHHGKEGIISVSWNPGNLRSELQRHLPGYQAKLLDLLLLYPTIYGAYTELYAGWSPDITASHNGAYIAPWGRIYDSRKDITAGGKRVSEGGTGHGEKFWQYCEKETAKYA